MGRINLGRVIVGGIVAGIIIDIVEYVLNGVVLADRWNAINAAHNLPPFTTNAIIAFNIIGLITGIAAVWTYAAIRPRLGEGPGTAVVAALLIWVVGYLLPDAGNAVVGLFNGSITLILVVVGLVEIVVATLAGAFIYNE
ncbi:MAG TPA: hypothetical protein VHT03_11330 [Rhizomicrobium sp.]|jgi:hypothetical protein|nr:hypothetical protein [Rhizomicrobium sp.]